MRRDTELGRKFLIKAEGIKDCLERYCVEKGEGGEAGIRITTNVKEQMVGRGVDIYKSWS